ncbi:Scr1 family TA system antitoxin-like transcriptional regulator [Nonomuraea sp. NPDC004297]
MTSFQQARIDLGGQLRQLREAAHLSGKELAERLRWQPSKVSRLENARQTATEDDVVVWAQAVHASPDTTDVLISQSIALLERHDDWKQRHRSGLAAIQEDVRDLEARTKVFRVFEPGIIVGLLQTSEYARHVFQKVKRLYSAADQIDAAVRVRMQRQEILYDRFDILHLDDDPVIARPYTERRELLEGTLRPGFRWQVPVWFPDHASRAFESSRQLGLEGVVCKRIGSPYRPGRRSGEWTKVKNVRTAEVVIGGWQPGGGRRTGTIGSLLLGAYDPGGRLRYVGHVGTGFTEATLRDLRERLTPLERPDPPFDETVPREHARAARWVAPRLVGEVQYAEVTGDGRLRHPSWRGLRPDREPSEASTAGILRGEDGAVAG